MPIGGAPGGMGGPKNAGGQNGGGTGAGGRGGFSTGMFGATARRAPVQSPSYEASLSNLAKMAGTLAPGAGIVQGIKGIATGQWGPSYSGYQGQVNTPGSYDPTNRAFGQDASPAASLAIQRMLLTRGSGAQHMLPQQQPQQMFMPQQQAPQPQQMAAPKQAFAPGMFMNTGGKYGASAFRPGYTFLQGGL